MIATSCEYTIKSNWNIDFDCGIQHNSIDQTYTFIGGQMNMA